PTDASAPDGYDYTRLRTPLEVAKPDLVAPDCVTVPFSDGTVLTNHTLCGTSAAVPRLPVRRRCSKAQGSPVPACLRLCAARPYPSTPAAGTRAMDSAVRRTGYPSPQLSA